jgi:hypothetical protein
VRRNNHGRIQGRAGVALRKRRLAMEPLCRHCAERGITKVSDVPDHVLPLSMGGKDEDSNIQCLCLDCHSAKTSGEANGYSALNHPDWLEPSAIPLTIVSGPPASGKTTYLKNNAAPHDIVIDLDGIMRRLRPTYTHWSGALDKGLFNRAIRERNAMLGRLKNEEGRRAWFIISAPTQAERSWWQGKLGGEIVLLHPGVEECKRRAIERGTPNAVAGVDRWERASKQPWQAPRAAKAQHTIGVDGWPI